MRSHRAPESFTIHWCLRCRRSTLPYGVVGESSRVSMMNYGGDVRSMTDEKIEIDRGLPAVELGRHSLSGESRSPS